MSAARRAVAAAFAACLVLPAPAAAHFNAGVKARAEIDRQVDAWNRGDLEGALNFYCPDEDVTWVNSEGVSHGWQKFARSMRGEFGGGPDRMGVLGIAVLDARDLADGSSLVMLRWSIVKDGKRVMGGLSSQLWSDCEGRIRVVFEHAS